MDLGIKGKSAIICASSRGLGKACAFSLAINGVNITLNGRDESILENTKKMALKMTTMVKENFPDVHVVAGGIFPTLTPELFLKEPSISYVCVGEGEISFPDLCEKLREKKDPTNTRGFWMRDENGKIHKNPPAMLPDINKIPFPDFAAFDKSLLLKPMQGKIYKKVLQ